MRPIWMWVGQLRLAALAVGLLALMAPRAARAGHYEGPVHASPNGQEYIAHGPVTGGWAQRSDLTPGDLASAAPHFYWASQPGSQQSGAVVVSGSADAWDGLQYIGRVTGCRSVTVWRPDVITMISAEQEQAVGVWMVRFHGLQLDCTEAWDAQVETPAQFSQQAAGKWSYVQTVVPSRLYVSQDNVTLGLPFNGDLGLDASYPYAPRQDPQVPIDDPDAGFDTPQDAPTTDSPFVDIGATWSHLAVDDAFEMYVMYRPADVGNGHQWVPVHAWNWSWHASLDDPGSIPPGTTLGPITHGSQNDKPGHPWWSVVIPQGGGAWIPLG